MNDSEFDIILIDMVCKKRKRRLRKVYKNTKQIDENIAQYTLKQYMCLFNWRQSYYNIYPTHVQYIDRNLISKQLY